MANLRPLVAVSVALVTVAAVAAPSASAAPPKNCGTFKLSHNDKIANHAITKGNYRLDALGVSCPIGTGQAA